MLVRILEFRARRKFRKFKAIPKKVEAFFKVSVNVGMNTLVSLMPNPEPFPWPCLSDWATEMVLLGDEAEET